MENHENAAPEISVPRFHLLQPHHSEYLKMQLKRNVRRYIASLIPTLIKAQLVGKAVRKPQSIAICIIHQNVQ